MSEPSLALQALIRGRLAASAALTALVPAERIRSGAARPEAFPCVLIGEGQTAFGDFHDTTFADVHIWTKDAADEADAMENAKSIAGAVRSALRGGPWELAEHVCHDLRVTSSRFMRDPAGKGEIAHAVLTVQAIVQEAA